MEPTDERLNAICQGREIHMLISDPEQQATEGIVTDILICLLN
jgi:hypothetical protein